MSEIGDTIFGLKSLTELEAMTPEDRMDRYHEIGRAILNTKLLVGHFANPDKLDAHLAELHEDAYVIEGLWLKEMTREAEIDVDDRSRYL
jgi:hypothetical protein